MVCMPFLSLPSLPPTLKPIPGIHPLPRRMPPGPQTRKPPPGRSRHSEKIRFWLIGGVSTQRIEKDEGVNGEVWEFALRCARGLHFCFAFSLRLFLRLPVYPLFFFLPLCIVDADEMVEQLNGDAPYLAEPVDVCSVGMILFTLLAGSRSSPPPLPSPFSPPFPHLFRPFPLSPSRRFFTPPLFPHSHFLNQTKTRTAIRKTHPGTNQQSIAPNSYDTSRARCLMSCLGVG